MLFHLSFYLIFHYDRESVTLVVIVARIKALQYGSDDLNNVAKEIFRKLTLFRDQNHFNIGTDRGTSDIPLPEWLRISSHVLFQCTLKTFFMQKISPRAQG